jgi:hypothetical protein
MQAALARLMPSAAVLAAALAVAVGVAAGSGGVTAARSCAPLLRLAEQLTETQVAAGLTAIELIQFEENGTVRRRTIATPITGERLIVADVCDIA